MVALLTVAVALLIMAVSSVLGGTGEGLFNDAPAVIDLVSEKLEEANSAAGECPWLVLFYNSYCGHCRNYAPYYTKFSNELSKGSPVLIGAVNCVTSRDACSRMQIHGVPSLFLRGVKPHEKWVSVGDIRNLGPFIQSAEKSAKLSAEQVDACIAMKTRLLEAKNGGAAEKKPVAAIPTPVPATRPVSFTETTALELADIAGAFFLTLRDEVPMAASANIEVLRTFLRAVDRSLPLLDASGLLAAVPPEGQPFPVDAWGTTLKRSKIPVVWSRKHRDAVEWRKCRGSEAKYRGLPCGLWSLYHAMVINAPAGEGVATLLAVREYVRHFFTCVNCREHFLSFEFNLPQGATDQDAVVWLWQAHNKANADLVTAASTDPLVPKIQWPSAAQCAGCFRAVGVYDVDATVKFLKETYSLARITNGAHGAGKPGQGVAHPKDGALQQVTLPTAKVESARDALRVEQGENRSVGFALMVMVVVLAGSVAWFRGRRQPPSSKFGKK